MEAYWTINSLKVYQDTTAGVNTPAAAAAVVVVERDNLPTEAPAQVVRSVSMDTKMVYKERVSADAGNGNTENTTEVEDDNPFRRDTHIGAGDADSDAMGLSHPEGPRGKKISRHSHRHRHRHVHRPQHRS